MDENGLFVVVQCSTCKHSELITWGDSDVRICNKIPTTSQFDYPIVSDTFSCQWWKEKEVVEDEPRLR